MKTSLTSPIPVDCEASNDQVRPESSLQAALKYGLAGALLGIIFIKAEIISWYRIQEMFRLQSFHMYGVIGSAVVTGAISVWLIRTFNIKTLQGEAVVFHSRTFHWGQVIGGTLFGLGWAITGACPGPIFAQIGSGYWAVSLTLLSALAGTWVYGALRSRLPH
ncbi:MAG: YeeE/YedE thiosulfate transporter family protein [Bacteroidia bacterium]|nr:YeeE/YedE thiosulfate transporter family protein [Bacteroidia bacterium]